MRWIKEYENIHKKMQQENEKETPQHITMFFYYVDAQNNVEKIKKRRYVSPAAIEPEGFVAAVAAETTITAGELLRIIRDKRQPQYQLDEILFYECVTSERDAPAPAPAPAPAQKMRQIPLTLTDIELKPALFIFHDINSIIFIYKAKRPNRTHTENARVRTHHGQNVTLKSRTKRITRRHLQKIDLKN